MMHTKKFVSAGMPLGETDKVLIMLHGRGASAEDILTLSEHLDVKDFTLLAPEATNIPGIHFLFCRRWNKTNRGCHQRWKSGQCSERCASRRNSRR